MSHISRYQKQCRTLFVLLFLSSISLNVYSQNSYRDTYQQPLRTLDSIGVKQGMTIGEAGAGEGYLTFYLAKRVGPHGIVYANDINLRVLSKISERAEKDSIQNIVTVLGEVADPLFPNDSLDIIVILRAFHDFTEPIEWMENSYKYLQPEGRMIIIDMDPERAGFGSDHFMKPEKVLSIMEQTPFRLEKMMTFLARDNIYIFKRIYKQISED